MRKEYHKLVRDKTDQLVLADGNDGVFNIIESRCINNAVADKIMEEASEFASSQNIEELADLYAIVCKAAERFGGIEKVRLEATLKAEIRGGFDRNLFLLYVDEVNLPTPYSIERSRHMKIKSNTTPDSLVDIIVSEVDKPTPENRGAVSNDTIPGAISNNTGITQGTALGSFYDGLRGMEGVQVFELPANASEKELNGITELEPGIDEALKDRTRLTLQQYDDKGNEIGKNLDELR